MTEVDTFTVKGCLCDILAELKAIRELLEKEKKPKE